MRAEEKFATIFFTDIVGFTPLTERLPATELVALIETLKDFNASRDEQLNVRVGINSGNVIIGDIGAKLHRRDYTVIGDAVNTASRLEAIAKECGQSIVMSAAVAEHLPNEWRLQNLGTFPIRGQGQEQVFALKTDTEEGTQPEANQ